MSKDKQEGTELSLSVYDRIVDPMQAIKQLGEWIHKSQLFNTASVEQGCVLALEVMTRRCNVMRMAEQYHVMLGRLTMRADFMMAEFHRLGGKEKVLERTPERAAGEFTYKGETTTFSFSWAEAVLEPLVYEYKRAQEEEVIASLTDEKKRAKLKIKNKYATPRSRMQMLWARLVSDAVRTICPEVNAGAYVPEELGADSDAVGDVQVEVVEPTATAAVKEQVKAAEEANTVDVKPEPPVAATEQVKPTEQAKQSDTSCTPSQQQKIADLFAKLELGKETIDAILAKRQVNAIRSLSTGQAALLIANMESKLIEVEAAKNKQAGAFTKNKSDPVSEVDCVRLRALIAEVGAVDPEVGAKVKDALTKAGKKLAEISAYDAEVLTSKLTLKLMDEFFRYLDEQPLGVVPGN